MTRGGAYLVWCPFPDAAEARAVAGQLLDEKLIACANLIPGIVSLYEWDGARGEACEIGVLFNTHESLSDTLISRLAQLHSYKSPAITGWIATVAPQTTQDWLGSLITGSSGQ